MTLSPTERPDQGHGLDVAPEAPLEMADFQFGFDHVHLFAPSHMSAHLSHQIPRDVTGFEPMNRPSDSWNPQFSPGPTVEESTRTTSAIISQEPDAVSSGLSDFPSKKQFSSPGLASPAHDGGVSQPARQRRIMLTRRSNRGQPTASQWMLQTSEVNSRLWELSAQLPSQGCLAASPIASGADAAADARAAGDLQTGLGFPVDEMFQLSRKLVDIIEDISPLGEDISQMPETGSPAEGQIDPRSDPGSSLFILSTYVRLLDMYQKVFSCLHQELPQIHAGAPSQQPWRLPEITIGSFPVSSPPNLQLSLTIQLAEEFLSQLRTTMAMLDQSLQENNGVRSPAGKAKTENMFSPIFNVSYQAIKTREEALGKQLAELGRELDRVAGR